jgi:hypothetical protein
MPNYGYHLARAQGRLAQAIYQRRLPRIAPASQTTAGNVPLDVFAYSSKKRLAEQVASIRSFLKHAGRPSQFVVVSDGSHSGADIELLRKIDPCVSVEQVPAPPAGTSPIFRSYLREHPTGKQLALIMSLPRSRPALYVDSDVRFFQAARNLQGGFPVSGAAAYYMEDCGFSGDDRLLHDPAEKAQPVNTGVLLLGRRLDWSLGIERFMAMRGEPTFFTNQTITHLVMHANNAQPLDPKTYVLQLDDQFRYRDRYAGPDLVLRHYVDPVRHKFWTSLWL